jgi:uncharacterized protein (DUF779 family)
VIIFHAKDMIVGDRQIAIHQIGDTKCQISEEGRKAFRSAKNVEILAGWGGFIQ